LPPRRRHEFFRFCPFGEGNGGGSHRIALKNPREAMVAPESGVDPPREAMVAPESGVENPREASWLRSQASNVSN
jgi:hypothetical protein